MRTEKTHGAAATATLTTLRGSDIVHFVRLGELFLEKEKTKPKKGCYKTAEKWQVSHLLHTVSAENRFFKRAFEKTIYSRDRVQTQRFWKDLGHLHWGFTMFFETITKPSENAEIHLWAQIFEFQLGQGLFDERARKVL
jgi:hypothetical protein